MAAYLGSQTVYLVRLNGGHATLEATYPIPTEKAKLEVNQQVCAPWEFDHAVYLED